MACTISSEDIKKVKGMGFLNNRGTNCFNARVLTVNGKITAAQARVIAEAAEKFGNGEVTFTSRMTVEIPGIPFDQIEAFQIYIASVGLETGGTGPKVRPVVSCKGTTCTFGLYDTFGVAEKIHQRFYKGYHEVKLPHKFKIAAGGCPNNCVKPDLNDLGIVGQRIPQLDMEKCRGCGKCQMEIGCPMKAAMVVNGKVTINPEICNNCGRCIGKCPFGVASEGKQAYKVYVGGRWGKKVARGQALSQLITSEEELLNVVEKAILFFKDQGVDGERFADTIERVGFAETERQLMGNELLERKAEIID